MLTIIVGDYHCDGEREDSDQKEEGCWQYSISRPG